jgi:hypothetical protein
MSLVLLLLLLLLLRRLFLDLPLLLLRARLAAVTALLLSNGTHMSVPLQCFYSAWGQEL